MANTNFKQDSMRINHSSKVIGLSLIHQEYLYHPALSENYLDEFPGK
jgi:hypothetical protein